MRAVLAPKRRALMTSLLLALAALCVSSFAVLAQSDAESAAKKKTEGGASSAKSPNKSPSAGSTRSIRSMGGGEQRGAGGTERGSSGEERNAGGVERAKRKDD